MADSSEDIVSQRCDFRLFRFAAAEAKKKRGEEGPPFSISPSPLSLSSPLTSLAAWSCLPTTLAQLTPAPSCLSAAVVTQQPQRSPSQTTVVIDVDALDNSSSSSAAAAPLAEPSAGAAASCGDGKAGTGGEKGGPAPRTRWRGRGCCACCFAPCDRCLAREFKYSLGAVCNCESMCVTVCCCCCQMAATRKKVGTGRVGGLVLALGPRILGCQVAWHNRASLAAAGYWLGAQPQDWRLLPRV